MLMNIVFSVILVSLISTGVLTAVIVSHTLKDSKDINLVQGKLENSDLSISEAISYLKVTNEWGGPDGTDE